MTTTFKHINVDLVGEDGNAYSIIGRVQKAMRRGDCTQEEMDEVMAKLINGDYNNLLYTVMSTFSVDGEGEEKEECCDYCGDPHNDCECEDYA